MELKGVDRVKLDWIKREEVESRDYDAGMDYEFTAFIPFELEYVVSYDDSEYEEEAHDLVTAAIERGDDGLSYDEWAQIRADHGEPSEARERWRVELRSELGKGGDFVWDVACGLTAEAAKAAALENYKLRVAAAVDGWPLY